MLFVKLSHKAYMPLGDLSGAPGQNEEAVGRTFQSLHARFRV